MTDKDENNLSIERVDDIPVIYGLLAACRREHFPPVERATWPHLWDTFWPQRPTLWPRTGQNNDGISLSDRLLERMGIQAIMDSGIKPHGNWLGLSPGWVITLWLTHILSEKIT